MPLKTGLFNSIFYEWISETGLQQLVSLFQDFSLFISLKSGREAEKQTHDQIIKWKYRYK